MPMTDQQADQIIRRLRLTWEGTDADLNITYRPNLLNRAEFNQMRQLAQEAQERGDVDTDPLAALLSRVIIGWDFLQPPMIAEDGTVTRQGDPYPIDVASINRLGTGIQIEIVQKMQGAPDPLPKRPPAASSGVRILPAIETESRQTDSFASSQDGTGESLRLA